MLYFAKFKLGWIFSQKHCNLAMALGRYTKSQPQLDKETGLINLNKKTDCTCFASAKLGVEFVNKNEITNL